MAQSKHVAQGDRPLCSDQLSHQLFHDGDECAFHAPASAWRSASCSRKQNLDTIFKLNSAKSDESANRGSYSTIHDGGLRGLGQDNDEPFLQDWR